MKSRLNTIGSALVDVVNETDTTCGDEIDRTCMFLDWIIDKISYFISEQKPLKIPINKIPKTISGYIMNKMPEEKKSFLGQYYDENSIGDFEINLDVKDIPDEDLNNIARELLLYRGGVCWVNFGFKVGKEFGGKHPALILKNDKSTLLVVPLSSQEPKEEKPYIVPVPFVYKFPDRKRWANVTRLENVSTYRVDFNSSFGNVKGEVIDDVRKAVLNLLK